MGTRKVDYFGIAVGIAITVSAASLWYAKATVKNDSQQPSVPESFIPAIMACKIHQIDDEYVDLMCNVRIREEYLEQYEEMYMSPPGQMQPPVVEKEPLKWSISYQL